MKTVWLVVCLIVLSSCATYKECQQIKEYFWKDDNCPTGWTTPGITGHPPICLDEENYRKIKAHCGAWF